MAAPNLYEELKHVLKHLKNFPRRQRRDDQAGDQGPRRSSCRRSTT